MGVSLAASEPERHAPPTQAAPAHLHTFEHCTCRFRLASEGIPGKPAKSGIPSEWIQSLAAALAEAFLTIRTQAQQNNGLLPLPPVKA
jgi:hypothetical protein